MNSFLWHKNSTPEELHNLLTALGSDYPLSNTGGALELCFEKCDKPGHTAVRYSKDRVLIEYASLSGAARAIGCALAGVELDETMPFKTFGIMLDCSRNAVMTVKHFKSWLRRIALMGYNMAMLYTEDTYKLPDEEYFGYMRGAYTLDEIREVNTCAKALGIKMIPCIQTLGHLEQVLKWSAYDKVKDNEGVLLADCDKTYVLIEKMVQFWREGLEADRIHIGMDEAHGLGRGKFMDIHGYERAFDIFNRHLAKVGEICRKHGMKPAIWSDMYFRMGNPEHDYYRLDSKIPEEVVKAIPEDVDIFYWDYYNKDEAFYNDFIAMHRKLGHCPGMASGIWTWMRLWYDHVQNEKTVIPCINACRNNGIEEFIFTMWGDNGGCCDIDSALAGLCWAADVACGNANPDPVRLEKIFRAITGGSYHNHLKASELESYVVAGFADSIGIQCLLWDDPLLGIFWNNEKLVNPGFAEELTEVYDSICDSLSLVRKENQAGDMNHAWRIADYLRKKIDFRKTLETAYAEKDRKTMILLVEDNLPELIKACNELTTSFRRVWMKYFKQFGLEVIQTRQGGQLVRLYEAGKRIREYLNDEIDAIEELEEKVSTNIDKSYGYYRYWSTGSTTI